ETMDVLAELRQLRIPVGKIIVNSARTRLSTTVSRAALRRGLVAAGLPADEATVRGLHAEASQRVARERLEATLRADLAGLGQPVVELPLVTEGISRRSLADLAARLGSPG